MSIEMFPCYIHAFLMKKPFFFTQPTQQIIAIVVYQLIQRNGPEQRSTIIAFAHNLDF